MAGRDLIAASRRAVYPLLCVLAALLVVLAVLSVAARWLLANADDYRDDVAGVVGAALGVEVGMDGLHARLGGASVVVTASGLVLRATPLPLAVREATFQFDLARSLFALRPKVSAVRAAGVVLDVSFPGARLRGGLGALFDDDDAAAAPPDLRVEDLIVRWRDTGSGKTYRFENAHLALHRPGYFGRGLRALIETDLPPVLGRRLRLVFDVPDVAVSGTAIFYADLDGVEIGGGCEVTMGERCWEGRVSGRLWGGADGAGVRLGLSEAALQPGAATEPEFALGGSARWLGADGRLSLVATLADLPLARLPAWLPIERLPPRLGEWLRRAPRAGRVTRVRASFAGTPADFSFVDDVRLSAAITGAEVAYRKNRPPLRDVAARMVFEGGGLRARVSHARLLDTRSHRADVVIADVRRPLLALDAHARGPLADVLAYLSATGLLDAHGMTSAHLVASGDSRLRLAATTPLSRKVERTTSIEGTLDLEGSDLFFPTLGFGLDDMRGTLAFDRNGGRGDNLEARWKGYPVAIRAYPASGASVVVFDAAIAPSPVLADVAPAFADVVAGEAQWTVEASFPNPGQKTALADGAPFGVRVASDLRGLAVDLPAPAGKRGDTARNFVFETGGRAASWRVAYGDARAALSNVGGAWRGEVRIGSDAARGALEPAAALNVRGVIEEQTDFAEWMRWWRSRGGALGGALGGGGFASPAEWDVVFRRAAFGERVFGRLASKATRTPDGRLKLRLESQPIQGQVTFAPAGAAKPRVYVDFERLHLRADMFGGSSSSGLPDPAALPPLAIKIEEFRMDGIAVDDLRVVTNPTQRGLEVSEASFRGLEDGRALADVSLAGRWSGGDDPRSDLEFSLASEDYGSLLKLWGFQTSLQQGRGEVRGRIAWNDDLLRFGLGKLEGNVAISLQDGVIDAVEPGVGRLLGLLNISKIAQRFTLDFKDIFDKGLVFDDLHGDLSFGGGNMTTDNFAIESSLLDMTIRGRTGVATRDYDQHIEVVPHVSMAVPLLSMLVGGPVYAAAAYVLGKTTRLDKAVDKTATLHYTLTGPWEEPKVDFVGVPKVSPAP